jgi:hypothetical protein
MAKKIDERDRRPPRVGTKVDPDYPMEPPRGLKRTRSVQPKPAALGGDEPPSTMGPVEAFDTRKVATTDGPPGSNEGDPALRTRHDIRKGWFLTEAHRQAVNRSRMARCESYYDNEQWTWADAQTLKDRGQDPIVYNEVKPTIDWLIGTERRTRIDYVVMAQDEGPDADEDAQTKTKILKYLDETNQAPFERSWAAEDAFKAGIGWLEVGVRGDPSGVPIFVGAESWRNVLWDSQCQRRDIQDARYVFRIKVVDYDVAVALFPHKRDAIDRVIQTGDNLRVFSEWFGGMGNLITGLDSFNTLSDPLDYITNKPVDMFNARKRILLLECWSREPIHRGNTPQELAEPLQYRIVVSIMTEHDTLIESESPYKHNRFPFVPVWAYRNRRTGLPYSPIWPLLGPQDALNKRMSKSVFEANAKQVMLEKGAVDPEVMDPDELRQEFNDPNGMPVFNDGAISGGKVREVNWPAAVANQITLAENDRNTIRSISGVTPDNRGMTSQAQSGKAVLAKQDQGGLLTAELFDNLLLARKIEGEITLSLVEQFMVQPRTIRVSDDVNRSERIRINDPQADGTYLNDISARQAHFVIGEQAWRQSYAEASFEMLLQVLSQLAPAAPMAVINLLDLVFDMHPNLPRKQAIVQRIRAINGQTAPDGKMTPEQQAAMQQKQQMAMLQFQSQISKLQADIAQSRAKGEKYATDAMMDRLTAIYESAQAAQVLVSFPAAAPIADALLKSAGFQDQSAQGSAPPIPPGQPQLPPQPPHPMPAAPGGALPPRPAREAGHLAGHLQGIHTPGPDGLHGAPQ